MNVSAEIHVSGLRVSIYKLVNHIDWCIPKFNFINLIYYQIWVGLQCIYNKTNFPQKMKYVKGYIQITVLGIKDKLGVLGKYSM